jgi:hypothetical protein
MQPFLTPEVPQLVALAGSVAFAGSLFLILLSHMEDGDGRKRLVKVFGIFVAVVVIGVTLQASQPVSNPCMSCAQADPNSWLYWLLCLGC